MMVLTNNQISPIIRKQMKKTLMKLRKRKMQMVK